MKRIILAFGCSILCSSTVFAQSQITPPVPENVPPKPRFDAQAALQPPLPMPGMGSALSGNASLQKSKVIRVNPGSSEIINVSNNQANRIATPFAKPRAVGVLPEQLVIEAVGQSLYVQMPWDSADPLALFVTGAEGNDPVISLILIPQAIPSQTAILQLDRPEIGAGRAGPIVDEKALPDEYENKLVDLLRTVALGKIPSSMTEADLPRAVGRRGPIIVKPETRYSSSTLDLWIYRVESVHSDEIELDDSAFWEEGVRAVAIMPQVRLQKGEHSFVYVISDKSPFDSAEATR